MRLTLHYERFGESDDDLRALAHSYVLASSREHDGRAGTAACRRVREEFCVERVVPMYEACYRAVVDHR